MREGRAEWDGVFIESALGSNISVAVGGRIEFAY